ncbi:hypothetical protein PTKIN_Ptkin16aG0002100 [Pterospermum kingtungense]
MEDDHSFSLILHGCKLAEDLESNLGNLAYHTDFLSKFCDDIVKIFATARERLNAQVPVLSQNSSSQQQQQQLDPSLQEWLKINGGVFTQAMDKIQQQLLAGKTSLEIQEMVGKMLLEGSFASAGFNGNIGGDIQAMDVPDSGRVSSSAWARQQRRRKDGKEKCRMRVRAPEMGNAGVPPEDNYTWRKYGQKEILGSRYPRAYYRCTHQKIYNCPAKKQVQRLDNDFYTFDVTYIGHHTCHMSSTAPTISPPLPPPLQLEIGRQEQIMTQPTVTDQPTPTSGIWLSMQGPGGSRGGFTTAKRYGRNFNW